MKIILKLLTLPLLLPCLFVFAQVKTLQQKQMPQIEINPYFRWDNYPGFSYVLNGRPSTDHVKINGTSWGIAALYKYPIKNKLFLEVGIGYYKYSFSNIKKVNTQFGEATARDINYYSGPIGVNIAYYTNKYWYNVMTADIAMEKLFRLKKNIQIATALNLNNYFTFSQYYHLTYNPVGSQDYKKDNKRYFGSSVIIRTSLLQRFNRMSIGPSIIIPIWDIWKTDTTFPEETNTGSRRKWLNSIGISISCNYSLTKK